jgi:hypothetical protein
MQETTRPMVDLRCAQGAHHFGNGLTLDCTRCAYQRPVEEVAGAWAEQDRLAKETAAVETRVSD